MTKFFNPIFLFLLLTACGTNKTQVKTNVTNDSNQTVADTPTTTPFTTNLDWETKVMDTIMGLPEIIEIGNEIEKNSEGKNHLTCLITETPEDNANGRYGIKVGEDTGDRVVGIYNFNVYVPVMRIMFDDPLSGDELTLFQWRTQMIK